MLWFWGEVQCRFNFSHFSDCLCALLSGVDNLVKTVLVKNMSVAKLWTEPNVDSHPLEPLVQFGSSSSLSGLNSEPKKIHHLKLIKFQCKHLIYGVSIGPPNISDGPR
jgi:hypothetical protein